MEALPGGFVLVPPAPPGGEPPAELRYSQGSRPVLPAAEVAREVLVHQPEFTAEAHSRPELGITADLTTLGPPGSDALLIGGSDGTLLGRDSDGWRPLVPPFTGDVADISSRYLLTAPGEIYSYEFHPLTLSKVSAPGLGLYTLSEAVSDGVVALGKPGRQVRVSEACGSTSGL